MKISDLIFQFETGRGNKARSLCRVRIFVTMGNQIAAVFTDLVGVGHGSIGLSVTNSVELIRAALIRQGLVPNDAVIVEHYENASYREATFDLVTFAGGDTPSWKKVSFADACMLLGCERDEFNSPTREDVRLFAEVERLRNAIDPFAGSPYPEDPDVINRRADIEANMISKQALNATVDAGTGEAELHKLLKSDLSIVAEVYADPDEEYMCFSEFPVGDGFVDFALFSGRSRMDVVLVEIKGADFHLANGGSYQNFSSKANEAIQQIRTRVGVVYRNMEKFRCEVHAIRQQVETGKSLYGSFVGPYGKLEVDPKKDINIKCVVIAGRTRNDLEESRHRHDYEWNVKPPVKIETWDSWLRKLRRL
ncbi:DUF4263 domain-containing protein [Caballeronia sp. LjRoot34]|uniref:Shedu immune nuclease family protein n=1 Tax=Caballeronia sp. LjRoot34 TaxID=3342325 RepID=UPI003ED0A2F5